MTFKDDLVAKVRLLSGSKWDDVSIGYVLPDIDSLTFDNTGRVLSATVLYADISDSTDLVNTLDGELAAEYYKAFLHCASQIIKKNGGDVCAYDGDRVMGLFLGASHADCAVDAAFEINYCVSDIINLRFATLYENLHRRLQHTVGIDTGRLLVIKVGVRAVGELAFIGPAANYAAKLNSFEGLDHDFPTRITMNTFDALTRMKIGPHGETMWEGPYKNLGEVRHYRSSWHRPLP